MVATYKSKEDLKAGLPDVTSTVTVKGLDGDIEILRDDLGIPHLKATTAHDAWFGQGFATAQDRLWHMDFDRRKAYGRWAELAGQPGVESDIMMRRFRIGATVKSDYEAQNDETRAMIDAYTAGVNAFIDTTETLPVEYDLVDGKPERWEPWDCCAVFKIRHIMMGVFEGKLWRARVVNTLGPEKAAELLQGYQPGHLVIVPPGATFDGPVLNALDIFERGLSAIEPLREHPDAGSNSWALHGSRTASGKPLLAGDPHRGLDTPNVYYQNQISCPDFDAIGLSFPGCPGFPHFGHNEQVAWCVTHAGADYQDIFIEKFDAEDPTRYEYKGEWKQAEIHHEVINVRGADSVEIEVPVTVNGPVIAGDPKSGNALSFRYTATAETNFGFQCLTKMVVAQSVANMDEAMREWVDPCNNFMCVDVHGDIEYLNRGQVPIRSMANAWLPVPGWTGEHDWDGNIPFEELARSKNPDNGFIVTANNRIVGDDYPYFIALDYATEYRAKRIWARLESLEDATIDDMASVHAERVSIPARIYSKVIADVEPLNNDSTKAQEIIGGWDGSMERDLVAPTIYSAFRGRLMQTVVKHLVGPLADDMLSANGRGAPRHLQHLVTRLNVAAESGDTSLLPDGEDWKSIAAKSLSEAVSDLKSLLGNDVSAWTWGRVHFTNPKHSLSDSLPDLAELLDPPSVPMGGDGDTPQAGSYSPGDPYTMTGMSVSRYAFDVADWDNSRWIVPLGSSGHPGSPHYADQAPTWGEVQMVPMTYSWDKVKASAKTTQVIKAG